MPRCTKASLSVVAIAVMMAAGCDNTSVQPADDTPEGLEISSKSGLMKIPDEFPGHPFYFTALNPLLPFVNLYRGYPEWVPVVFYHPVECMPEGTDLLFAAPSFESLACPSTVEGFLIKPEGYAVPKVETLRALDEVPFWFVTLDDWYAAVADGHVWVDEFTSLPSFRAGSASFFLSNLNPKRGTFEAHGVVTSEPGLTFSIRLVSLFENDDSGIMVAENIPIFDVDFFEAMP
jgi:hypothetical protein